MALKEQELLQIDEEFIQNLLKKDPDALASLSTRLTNDLKEAVERLNQNPNNSSRPSGSLAPWEKSSFGSVDDLDIEAEATSPDEDYKENTDHEKPNKNKKDPQTKTSQSKLKPGKQPGSQGYGRTQKLQVTDIKHHHCPHCPVCKGDLGSAEKAYTGFTLSI